MRFLISYDIPDDRRRTKLAHFLLDYGDRVHYSVFEFPMLGSTLRLSGGTALSRRILTPVV